MINVFLYVADDMRIDFSSRNDHACTSSLFDLPTESALTPWEPKIITSVTKFSVKIGPTGGKRGYTPITGENNKKKILYSFLAKINDIKF